MVRRKPRSPRWDPIVDLFVILRKNRVGLGAAGSPQSREDTKTHEGPDIRAAEKSGTQEIRKNSGLGARSSGRGTRGVGNCEIRVSSLIRHSPFALRDCARIEPACGMHVLPGMNHAADFGCGYPRWEFGVGIFPLSCCRLSPTPQSWHVSSHAVIHSSLERLRDVPVAFQEGLLR